MSAEILATFYQVGHANLIAQSMDSNQVDVLVLTPNQYMSILHDRVKQNPRLEGSLRSMLANSQLGKYWAGTFNPNLSEPWVGPVALGANDAIAISKTLQAIGMAGITSYVKTTASGTYIIIKGYSAKRSGALTGTRYLATNPVVMKLGLGVQSLKGIAKGGFILGLVVSSGIEVTDFIFNDQKTMFDLVGGIGVEAVKCGLGSLVAYSLASAVGAMTAIAVAPLVVMAIAVLVAGVALNALDNHYSIKSRVVAALKATPENIEVGLYKIAAEANDWLDSPKKKVNEVGRAIDQGLRNWLCPICRRY